jgi:hypothetical protein
VQKSNQKFKTEREMLQREREIERERGGREEIEVEWERKGF